MDSKKQTQETLTTLSAPKEDDQKSEDLTPSTTLPLINFDQNYQKQDFYKTYNRAANGQYIMKHGHKIFTIYRSQQDLAVFCLSLLQFQAEFPLRFFMVDSTKKQNEILEDGPKIKDVWIQTQFIISANTSKQGIPSTQIKLQKKIFKFFMESLIPILQKFKEERISWTHMVQQNYTDQKVINDFNQFVVKRINNSFKGYCSQS